MRAALSELKSRADAKARFGFQSFLKARVIALKFFIGNVEHRKAHTAGNINADTIRNHRIVHGQHSAYGQSIPRMSIRH